MFFSFFRILLLTIVLLDSARIAVSNLSFEGDFVFFNLVFLGNEFFFSKSPQTKQYETDAHNSSLKK